MGADTTRTRVQVLSHLFAVVHPSITERQKVELTDLLERAQGEVIPLAGGKAYIIDRYPTDSLQRFTGLADVYRNQLLSGQIQQLQEQQGKKVARAARFWNNYLRDEH